MLPTIFYLCTEADGVQDGVLHSLVYQPSSMSVVCMYMDLPFLAQ